ncbi:MULTISPECIES: cysteine desulfurase NifS [unclassified Methanoregula]|uniref:cysteine desulfurase NifS n=1 Tax=unclassified Methanoregula TaxID=2649730 RepID=UPI0009D28842|nr:MULTISPECIES: cysteine desulfurase NifS [unclassified Methanoregula]OPX62640.1 MAG: putative cysteine desulfurase 2 [Methanoregula sp. PtaB.Bin085]OPY33015.1 MAG: putative cysteine desulfurase 2 [Methanoregula sp. PtaU1.Bin006]
MADKRIIYMDHSATTCVRKEVLEAMAPYHAERFGNPSSIYSIARESKKAVEAARGQVAKALGADPDEIYFTSGGSESDNWAIKGVALANRQKGNHIITTKIEHHAVLHTCQYLEKEGFRVTYLPVDRYGLVSPADLEKAITDTTILISVMYANNEIGTIEPIAELGAIAKKHKVPFHTDAVQAIGNIPIDVKAQDIDLLSLSAHKFYGPKGVGALYIRKGLKVHNLIHGGGQERRRRAGTENLAGIVGLGKAIELATADIEGHNQTIRALRDRLLKGIQARISDTHLNGHPEKRLPGNINISFEFIEGESLLLWLDDEGICASTGSACSSGSLEPSHVLMATGLPVEISHGSLRLTLGDANTVADVDFVLGVLPGIVAKLREMSPLYKGKKGG